MFVYTQLLYLYLSSSLVFFRCFVTISTPFNPGLAKFMNHFLIELFIIFFDKSHFKGFE